MDTSVYVSFGVCCSDSMESSENGAGFLGMLLLELAVFVLWFRLCFAALEKLNLIKPPLSSDVQSYGVVIAGRVLFVWSECAFFSVLFWEDSKKRFWCCIRAVLEWFEFGAFFFSSSSSLYYFDGIHVYSAHLFSWNWRALANLNTEADELVSYTTPSVEGLWETENVLCVWVGDALKAYREDVTYCCLTT